MTVLAPAPAQASPLGRFPAVLLLLVLLLAVLGVVAHVAAM